MMEHMALPGLDRLLRVCGRTGVGADIAPPSRSPPAAGKLVGGYPLDPMLAAFYARCGRGYFAKDIYLLRVDDTDDQLVEQSQRLREDWQRQLAGMGLPLVIFGGVASLAYSFATVPTLADAEGRQPVVEVDAYSLDGPSALPLASNVDRLFDTYSRYLEELVVHEDFQASGAAALSFPWKVPHLLARDERLVQLIREGRFDPLMTDADARSWAAEVVAARQRLA